MGCRPTKKQPLTLPARLALALVAQVVGRVRAVGVVGAGVGRARREDLGAGGAAVGQLAQAREAGHTVHARALVLTRAGRTLVDVDLAEVPCKRVEAGKRLRTVVIT